MAQTSWRSLKVSASICLALLLVAMPAAAAPGDADPAFSLDGLAFFTAPFPKPLADAVAVQPDGRIVVAVHSTRTRAITPITSLYVARLKSNGSLDKSFGDHGFAELPGSEAYSPLHMDVAVQPNGRILVSAFSQSGRSGFGLVGLRADGSLDPSFGGGDGIVSQTLPKGAASTQDIALAPDGRIVVAGGYEGEGERGYAVGRLLADGSPDTSFGESGFSAALSTQFDIRSLAGVAVRPDGRIVIAGNVDREASAEEPIAAIQFSSQGPLDSSFGVNGVALLDAPGGGGDNDLALDSQGRLLVATTDFAIACPEPSSVVAFAPDGGPDPSFGSGGVATLSPDPFGNSCLPQFAELAVDSTDHPALLSTGYALTLAHLTAEGAPDPAFSGDGWLRLFSPSVDFETSSPVTGDLIVVGDQVLASSTAVRSHPARTEPVIARFQLSDGPPDADADGVADSADRCPEAYGNCPRLKRKLKAHFDGEGRSVRGRLRGDAVCSAGVRVALVRRGHDSNDVRARARSDESGRFRLKLHGRAAGSFQVRTEAEFFAFGRCPAKKSSPIAPRR
jgi:uncharacterized delta-60 repeat protein